MYVDAWVLLIRGTVGPEDWGWTEFDLEEVVASAANFPCT